MSINYGAPGECVPRRAGAEHMTKNIRKTFKQQFRRRKVTKPGPLSFVPSRGRLSPFLCLAT